MNYRSDNLTYFDRLGSKYPIEKRTYLRALSHGGGVEKFYLHGEMLEAEVDGSLVVDFKGQKIPLRPQPWPEDGE